VQREWLIVMRFSSVPVFVVGFVLSVFVTASTNECHAQKQLAWKLPQGRTIKVVMVEESKMQLDGAVVANSAIRENTTKQTTEMTWGVAESNGTVNKVEQAVDRVVFEMKTPTMAFVVDTNDPKPMTGIAETMAANFRSMAGSSFLVTMKPSGEVVELTIPDELKKKWAAGATGMSESGMKELAVNCSLQLPQSAVRVGDTWQQKHDLDFKTLGKLTVTTSYQYLGEEIVDKKVLDKIRATIAMRTSDANDASGLKLSKQESGGIIWFDNVSGRIDHSEHQQDLAMDVTNAGKQIKQTVTQQLNVSYNDITR
jgi:hypothetical protein